MDFLVSGIQKPDILVRFFEWLVPYHSIVTTQDAAMVRWYHSKTGLYGPDFKWHSETGPSEYQTCLDHSKTGLVQFSDGYCILKN